MGITQKFEAFLLCFIIIRQTGISSADVSFKNNGYSGIVVAFASNIDEKEGTSLIDNIRELFINASKLLYNATYRMAYFKEVIILVPETWSDKIPTASSETFHSASVRITEQNAAAGDGPYTLQHMGCGHPGLYIHLTQNYLQNLNGNSTKKFGDPAKVLIHEWAHYRYGIFDEYGYPDDDIFPMFYYDSISEDLLPNYCANGELIGKYWNVFDDEPCDYGMFGFPDKKCIFMPNENNEASTSLTSYYQLPHVNFFCNETNHNIFAPNKQNLLCNYRSAWEVIKQNKDFVSTIEAERDPGNVTFKIIKQGKPTFILVLDTSGSMNQPENGITRIEMVKIAVEEWVKYQVMIGWSIGIVSFNAKAEVKLHPKKVMNDSDKEKIIQNFPNSPSGNTCIGCGLRKAIDILGGQNSGGTIILVSDGEENKKPYINEILTELQASRVRVISIVFTHDADKSLELVANITKGKTFFAPLDNGIEALKSAFYEISIVEQTNSTETIKVAETQFSNTSRKTLHGSFLIDSTIVGQIDVSVSYYEDNDISNMTIFVPNGTMIANLTSASQESKSYRLYFDFLPSGHYHYKIRRGSSTQQIITVTVVAKATLGFAKPITTKCWIEEENWNNTKRIIIFATVKQGTFPVIRANVSAKIKRPDKTVMTIQLLDNGKGADVHSNDGIYSKYFIHAIKTSSNNDRYSVMVSITSNNNSVIREGRFRASKARPIITDFLNITSHDKPTGLFERISDGGSFQMSQISPDTITNFPPIRVVDLTLVEFNENGMVTISFTAPGSDFDEGIVSEYEIKYSEDFDSLLNKFNGTSLNTSELVPLKAGEIQTFNACIPEIKFNVVVFLALRSADNNSNWSELSNIIRIHSRIKSTITSTTKPSTYSTTPLTSRAPFLTTHSPSMGPQITKIVDLQLTYIYANGTVEIQWTPPDNVYQYVIKYSTDIDNIANHFEGVTVDTKSLIHKNSEGVQSYAFSLPSLNSQRNVYLALQVADKNFKWSPTSNIIILRKPKSNCAGFTLSASVGSIVVCITFMGSKF